MREALSRLRADGIVASQRGSGSYVVRPPGTPAAEVLPIKNLADIERYYAFRACVEAGAAAGAAEFRNAGDLEAMRAAFEALSLAMESGRVGVDEDVSFHLAIARASHNQFFVTDLEDGRIYRIKAVGVNGPTGTGNSFRVTGRLELVPAGRPIRIDLIAPLSVSFLGCGR